MDMVLLCFVDGSPVFQLFNITILHFREGDNPVSPQIVLPEVTVYCCFLQ